MNRIAIHHRLTRKIRGFTGRNNHISIFRANIREHPQSFMNIRLPTRHLGTTVYHVEQLLALLINTHHNEMMAHLTVRRKRPITTEPKNRTHTNRQGPNIKILLKHSKPPAKRLPTRLQAKNDLKQKYRGQLLESVHPVQKKSRSQGSKRNPQETSPGGS